MSSSNRRVSIIVLNWNGYSDTINCIQSLVRLQYTEFDILICDNASTDGSVDKIEHYLSTQSWCTYDQETSTEVELAMLNKRIRRRSYRLLSQNIIPESNLTHYVSILETGGNLGFAGGNNVGIAYSCEFTSNSLIWILNNDTEVNPKALESLVERFTEAPNCGICGSTLLYFNDKDRIQALGGGTFSYASGKPSEIGKNQIHTPSTINIANIESQLDYISGASMLISSKFIRDVGLLCEDYFLYYEELDWAVRCKNRYSLCYASNSIVYHKEGGSIGTGDTHSRSTTAEYYSLRSRLLFIRKHRPKLLPYYYILTLLTLIKRVFLRDLPRAKAIAKAICTSNQPVTR